jgi:hypothetical protein
MNEQPILSDEEWALVIDLLRLELRELPVEIHHVQNSERRQTLHHRRELIDGLVNRLTPATVPAS